MQFMSGFIFHLNVHLGGFYFLFSFRSGGNVRFMFPLRRSIRPLVAGCFCSIFSIFIGNVTSGMMSTKVHSPLPAKYKDPVGPSSKSSNHKLQPLDVFSPFEFFFRNTTSRDVTPFPAFSGTSCSNWRTFMHSWRFWIVWCVLCTWHSEQNPGYLAFRSPTLPSVNTSNPFWGFSS